MNPCAWCGKPSTTTVEVAPAGSTTVKLALGQMSMPKPARKAPACEVHADVTRRPDIDALRRVPADPKAQLSIFDML